MHTQLKLLVEQLSPVSKYLVIECRRGGGTNGKIVYRTKSRSNALRFINVNLTEQIEADAHTFYYQLVRG